MRITPTTHHLLKWITEKWKSYMGPGAIKLLQAWGLDWSTASKAQTTKVWQVVGQAAIVQCGVLDLSNPVQCLINHSLHRDWKERQFAKKKFSRQALVSLFWWRWCFINIDHKVTISSESTFDVSVSAKKQTKKSYKFTQKHQYNLNWGAGRP